MLLVVCKICHKFFVPERFTNAFFCHQIVVLPKKKMTNQIYNKTPKITAKKQQQIWTTVKRNYNNKIQQQNFKTTKKNPTTTKFYKNHNEKHNKTKPFFKTYPAAHRAKQNRNSNCIAISTLSAATFSWENSIMRISSPCEDEKPVWIT